LINEDRPAAYEVASTSSDYRFLSEVGNDGSEILRFLGHHRLDGVWGPIHYNTKLQYYNK
jgi:hypothetical protein